MVVFIGLGERIGSRFIPKYIQVLGGTVLAIGLYGAMENLLGALWALPGGILSDRLGTKRALALFNMIAILGYAIVVLVPVWPAVLVAAIFFLAWSAISLPATMSVVVNALPRTKRAMGVSMHSLIRRVPMALGPVIGGALIAALGLERGVRASFAIAIVLAVAAIVLQQRMVSPEPKPYEPIHPIALLKRFDPGLRRLLVSDILIRFCEQIPYAFVIIWVMDVAGKSAQQFGWLSAVEMATAALIYIPVAHFSDRAERKPFVVVTFVFFTLFPAALYFARGTAALAAVFILRGLKEFGEPTRKALIVDLAESGLEGRTVGAYYLVRDLVVCVAALAGGVLWSIGPAWNLWVAFACGVAGTLYFALFGRGVAREAGAP
ncbi:MAG: MFS transporter [Candidatus Eisenbacteria bacterium]|nr:MFS transporter [Candidatus Eisenbacteria bacterium]